MIVIPDNACVNSSIFWATDTATDSVGYFGESHLATLYICVLTSVAMLDQVNTLTATIQITMSQKFTPKPGKHPLHFVECIYFLYYFQHVYIQLHVTRTPWLHVASCILLFVPAVAVSAGT